MALVLATALLALLAGGAATSAAVAAAAELPTCAEGPEVVGDEVLGTPCADEIVVPPTATTVGAFTSNQRSCGRGLPD